MISAFLDWASHQILGLDKEVQSEIAAYAGKLIKIEFLGAEFSFYCQPTHSGVRVFKTSKRQPDAVIRGTPISLAIMGVNQKWGWLEKPSGIEIQGDAELVHELMLLMKKFRIDWEEFIAQALGDRVAQHVGSQFRAADEYGSDVAQRFRSNTVDYLQEELQLLPPHEEVQDFMADVDELRDRVERLVLLSK